MTTLYNGQIVVTLAWEWTENPDESADELLDAITQRIWDAAAPILEEYRARPGVRSLDLV